MGNAIAALERKGSFAVIDQDDADLAPVVGVDGARAVEQSDPMLQGQAGTRADLRLIARRQGDGEARRNEAPRTRRQFHRFGYGRH